MSNQKDERADIGPVQSKWEGVESLTGTISTPNYPKQYVNNQDKEFHINVNVGIVIQLQNCGNCACDWVKITDGDGTELLPKTCGTTVPTMKYSQSKTNHIIIQFNSNSKYGYKDFNWSG